MLPFSIQQIVEHLLCGTDFQIIMSWVKVTYINPTLRYQVRLPVVGDKQSESWRTLLGCWGEGREQRKNIVPDWAQRLQTGDQVISFWSILLKQELIVPDSQRSLLHFLLLLLALDNLWLGGIDSFLFLFPVNSRMLYPNTCLAWKTE